MFRLLYIPIIPRCASRHIQSVSLLIKRNISKKYSATLNLPKTSLPLSMKDGSTVKREIEIQKSCDFRGLYRWQSEQPRDKRWVLHDGPPYANGRPHVGHALNKILKDVVNRYKLLCGYAVHYVPGWDCHGTPIEQRALADLRQDHTQLEPMEIRNKARYFAKKTINTQQKEFERWAVMADWEKDCYYTYSPSFEVRQLEVFHTMYEKGLIYQDFMPVFWSPSSRTALAEAELEYNDHHESTAVYVKFPLSNLPPTLQQALGGTEKPVHAVIWTTTPWTLPANQAICYSPNVQYCVLKDQDQLYLVALDCQQQLCDLFGRSCQVLATLAGSELGGSFYRHPLTNQKLPLLPANHVTVAKGTGLVHTAPAHGPEDFQVAVNHGLDVVCHVDEAGCFTEGAGNQLQGQPVLGQGNHTVLELLSDHVLHRESYVHSYPYDWRTKQPVILRASKQWFVNTSKIKQRALDCLSSVSIHPAASGSGMLSQLAARTYWCISRQRAWGVPIPVFYHHPTGQPLITKATIEHLQSLFSEHGSDAWWTLPMDQLLPERVKEKSGFSASDEFIPGRDILDIWFDSGSTWAAVLEDGQADLYLEGLDQFGGWFQSSLLTSVAVQDQAPYRHLLVHGFTMDEEGKKMSKSEGNVIHPSVVINGGKDRKHEPAYGIDVLRWWAVREGLDDKVNIGPNVLQQCNEQVFKLEHRLSALLQLHLHSRLNTWLQWIGQRQLQDEVRKSLRYLLGNLHDFCEHEHLMSYEELEPQDQYMLYLLQDFMSQVHEAYDGFQLSRVPLLLEKFINTHVSSFYCHHTKDRLYCSGADSNVRRSCQTVQHHLLSCLLYVTAPILPHLADEIFTHRAYENESIFKTEWPRLPSEWNNPTMNETFDIVTSLRDAFFKVVPAENPLEYDLVIHARMPDFVKLKVLQGAELSSSESGLSEMLQCSRVALLSRLPLSIPDEAYAVDVKWQAVEPDGSERTKNCLLVVLPAENQLCERCRRYTARTKDVLCERCNDVLAEGWDR